MGLKPTIPASDRAKTVHALDRAATVTGGKEILHSENKIEHYEFKKSEVLVV
jgi:hypothetical protein